MKKNCLKLLFLLCLCFFLAGCGKKELQDGKYTVEVTMSGGTGRASIESPAEILVADGQVTATLIWSSPFYEYMIVDDVQYDPIQEEGNAVFQIPVILDEDMKVSASTIAMSQPYLVDYALHFDSSTLEAQEGKLGNGWEAERTMELEYATQFSVDYYADGYKLITLGDGSRFLVIPENGKKPEGIAEDIVPLYQPVENIYLAATSAMCLFDAMERLDAITLSGTKPEGWYIENARLAMEEGRIQYAGKYSEPDYELILGSGCELAIESTMIGHASEVKEKMEELGVPVFIDQSSLEQHPLGRTEWMKVYGALLNEEEKAEALFDRQSAYLKEIAAEGNSGKTVAFFHISSSGYVVARKSGDYVSRMIELAGGKYIFDDLGDPEKDTSTVTVEMETFFARAKDADYIIYNSTIGGEVASLSELLEKNELLGEFRAVQNGNVWCTSQNMFQETTQLGRMIQNFHTILNSEDPELAEVDYLFRLQ